jgi:glycopeptide antibiotics resistance protein
MSVLLSPRVAAWLLVAYGLAVLAVVLQPVPIAANGSVHYGYRALVDLGAPSWISDGTVEFAWNVVLFVPLTYFGSVLLPRIAWQQWVGLGLLASAAIELVQLLWLPDRTASLSDIISNTLGALLGALAVHALRQRNRRQEHQRETIG